MSLTYNFPDTRNADSTKSLAYICFVMFLMMLCANTVTAQGALTNGWTHIGMISPGGDSDSWTFSANAGDRIVIKVGRITQTAGTFNPRIRLLNPSAVQQASATDTVAAEIAVTATNSGTFTVIVEAVSATATGTYRLTLAKSPGEIFVAPGDEGGPLTNGVAYEGNYLPPGDLDVWNFTANAGDSIVLKVGQMSDTNNFDPWIRLYGPDGRLLSSAADTAAAEVTFRATNSGAFMVVIGNDPYFSDAASGTYRLTLAKTADPVVVSPGDDGGPMTNGVAHQGNLPVGDLDLWNFTANAGDSIVVKVGQITDTGNFDPWVRLYGPNGALLDSVQDSAAAEITLRATNSGTFLVVIGNYPYFSDAASGTYLLTLAKTGDPIVVLPNDEGGPMTNGVAHQGSLPLGDLDLWNFTATNGESIVIKVGQISDTNNFDPWVRLYGPNGALLGSVQDSAAAEVTFRATNSGTFLVVIGNYPYFSDAASGTYLLTLAKTGDPIVVSPGDDGGPMTNGVAHQGSLPLGDLDLWNFTATNGESIVIKMGQMSDTNNFDPWVRLYGPNGALLGSIQDSAAAEVTFRATNSGTFLVVIGNYPYFSDAASGTYLLTLAKTGDPIVVSPGDDGGPMTNGVAHQGSLPVGDLDLWNFTANAGDSIVIKMGQMSDTNNFDPWVRLYGPNGALLGSIQDSAAAEVTFRATNSGTFLVVVGNYPYFSDAASGTYRLTLGKTGNPIVVSPGDEGGSLTNGVAHQGNMPIGDLDLWNFTANAGESIVVRVGQISDAGNFDPWVRVYGPNGVLLGSDFGAAVGEVSLRATNSGTFLVVVGNNPYNSDAGNGTYLLSLAKTGDSIVVTPGDEGGKMTGSGLYNGTIQTGDLDLWTFTICTGELINLRVDEITETNSFAPWIRLYGPSGVLINSTFGALSAVVSVRATNSGTFLVVIGNNDYYNNAGSGTYALTVNGLSDALKLCLPIISGTNATLGGVGGVSNAVFRLDTTTNITTPVALWTPILTNQFDFFGTFKHTNPFSRTERERYFRLLQQ